MDDLFEENSIVRKLWHSISRIKKCNLLPTVTIFLKGWLWLFSPQIPTKNESNATEFVVCNLILSCLAYRHLRSKHDTKPAKTQYHDARKESQYNDTHFDCSFVSMLLLNRYLIWRSLILVKYKLNEKKKVCLKQSQFYLAVCRQTPSHGRWMRCTAVSKRVLPQRAAVCSVSGHNSISTVHLTFILNWGTLAAINRSS